MAELSLQRGDYDQARAILEKRIGKGAPDFKTLNLYGISLAHARVFESATAMFNKLQSIARTKVDRAKAVFNLGQTMFFKELLANGDSSVANSMYTVPGRAKTSAGSSRHAPFAEPIQVWENLLQTKPRYAEIIHTYLAFAYLQTGNLEFAIAHVANALAISENFYVGQYTLGRVFLDLYLLALEGNHFSVSPEAANFFEIEQFEVLREENKRQVVQPDTFLDIAIQAFLEAKIQNPLALSNYVWMCETYLFAGFLEEAQDALAHAEALSPQATATLEVSLHFHEMIHSKPNVIRDLVQRIQHSMGRDPQEIYNIMPSYFLF
jgi:tetratricopeptide (TPR) repeat protein